MKEEMMASLEAKIKTNNEKYEVLRCILVSWIDIHQGMTEAIQEEIVAKMDTHQERMGASVNAW
jgi:hypothetical protein